MPPSLTTTAVLAAVATTSAQRTRLYTHGDAGFPCIRIPATALQADGSMLAVAAGRCFTGDSCFPLATKTPAPSDVGHRGHGHWRVTDNDIHEGTGRKNSRHTSDDRDGDTTRRSGHRKRFIFDSRDGAHHNRSAGTLAGPSTSGNPDDDARQGASIGSSSPQKFTSVLVRRSTDGGASWGSLAVVAHARGANGSECIVSDPTMLVDTVRNRTIIMYNDPLGTVRSLHSDDFGVSWVASAGVLPWGPAGGSHIAPATGIQLSAEHPTAPGRLLVVGIVRSACELDKVFRSDDGGATWALSSSEIADCGEAQLAEMADGSIVLNCRNPKTVDKGTQRGRSVSRDGGLTWAPMRVDSGTPDPTNRSVVFFAHPTNLTQRRGGAVFRSDDGGVTWSKPFLIGNRTTQFAYSSLSYLPGGSGVGGVQRAPDRLGLSFETWAMGCAEYAPACAIDFVTVPTTW